MSAQTVQANQHSGSWMTKTVRDVHENARFVNRLDDAKAERLLMEIKRGKS
jgi:hypothetical protein